MIVAKTKLEKLPATCYECGIRRAGWSLENGSTICKDGIKRWGQWLDLGEGCKIRELTISEAYKRIGKVSDNPWDSPFKWDQELKARHGNDPIELRKYLTALEIELQGYDGSTRRPTWCPLTEIDDTKEANA